MTGDPLVWSEPFSIRAYEVGPDETASVLTVCDLLQEAAGEHARASDREGFPLPDGGWATWVLSRLRVVMHRRPAMREQIAVETWPSAMDGLRASRDFRVTGADGALLAAATSLWFLIDVDRRRPVRWVAHPIWVAPCRLSRQRYVMVKSPPLPVAVRPVWCR